MIPTRDIPPRRGLGVLGPDPASGYKADFPFRALARMRGLRRSGQPADLRPSVLNVLDQGPIGSCILNAIAQGMRMRWVMEGVPDPELPARMPLYAYIRALIGTEAEDSGGYVRDGFRALNGVGYAPERLYPYRPEKFLEDMADRKPFLCKPPPEWDRDAFDQRGAAARLDPARYWRCFTVDEMYAALDAKFPVVIGTNVSWEFTSFEGKKVFEPPRDFGDVAGGHAVCLVAHDLPDVGQDTCTAVGSWGLRAHDRGYHHFSRAYAEQFQDMWAIEHAPYYSKAAPS